MIRMGEFFSVNILIEVLCLCAAIIYLRDDRSIIWRSNIVFLLLTVIVEELGLHFKFIDQGANNRLVYNFYTLPEALFNSLMYYKILKDLFKSRPVIFTGLALIYITYIYELSSRGPYKYTNLTILVMSTIFSFYSFLYLYLFVKKEGYVELSRHAPFWWVTGSLIYYFGGQATDWLFTLIHFPPNVSSSLYAYIYIALNLMLYGFRSYSYRCRSQLKKSNFSSF